MLTRLCFDFYDSTRFMTRTDQIFSIQLNCCSKTNQVQKPCYNQTKHPKPKQKRFALKFSSISYLNMSNQSQRNNKENVKKNNPKYSSTKFHYFLVFCHEKFTRNFYHRTTINFLSKPAKLFSFPKTTV